MNSLKGTESQSTPSNWEEIVEPPQPKIEETKVPEKKIRKPLALPKKAFNAGDGAKDIGDFEKDILEFIVKNKSGSILGNVVALGVSFVSENRDKKPFDRKETKEEVKKDKPSKIIV